MRFDGALSICEDTKFRFRLSSRAESYLRVKKHGNGVPLLVLHKRSSALVEEIAGIVELGEGLYEIVVEHCHNLDDCPFLEVTLERNANWMVGKVFPSVGWDDGTHVVRHIPSVKQRICGRLSQVAEHLKQSVELKADLDSALETLEFEALKFETHLDSLKHQLATEKKKNQLLMNLIQLHSESVTKGRHNITSYGYHHQRRASSVDIRRRTINEFFEERRKSNASSMSSKSSHTRYHGSDEEAPGEEPIHECLDQSEKEVLDSYCAEIEHLKKLYFFATVLAVKLHRERLGIAIHREPIPAGWLSRITGNQSVEQVIDIHDLFNWCVETKTPVDTWPMYIAEFLDFTEREK